MSASGKKVVGLNYTSTGLTYQDAREVCLSHGGDLFLPESYEEAEHITAAIEAVWPEAVSATQNFHGYYIGLKDVNKEGTFLTADLKTPTWTYWDHPNNQPDPNLDEDCVAVPLKGGQVEHGWHDYDCTYIHAFLACEFTEPCQVGWAWRSRPDVWDFDIDWLAIHEQTHATLFKGDTATITCNQTTHDTMVGGVSQGPSPVTVTCMENGRIEPIVTCVDKDVMQQTDPVLKGHFRLNTEQSRVYSFDHVGALSVSWVDADDYCRSRGGHLVLPQSWEDTELIARDIQATWTSPYSTSPYEGVAIDLNDTSAELVWRNVEEDILTVDLLYSNWHPGEPNQLPIDDNNCVLAGYMDQPEPLQWLDVSCTERKVWFYVCEYPFCRASDPNQFTVYPHSHRFNNRIDGVTLALPGENITIICEPGKVLEYDGIIQNETSYNGTCQISQWNIKSASLDNNGYQCVDEPTTTSTSTTTTTPTTTSTTTTPTTTSTTTTPTTTSTTTTPPTTSTTTATTTARTTTSITTTKELPSTTQSTTETAGTQSPTTMFTFQPFGIQTALNVSGNDTLAEEIRQVNLKTCGLNGWSLLDHTETSQPCYQFIPMTALSFKEATEECSCLGGQLPYFSLAEEYTEFRQKVFVNNTFDTIWLDISITDPHLLRRQSNKKQLQIKETADQNVYETRFSSYFRINRDSGVEETQCIYIQPHHAVQEASAGDCSQSRFTVCQLTKTAGMCSPQRSVENAKIKYFLTNGIEMDNVTCAVPAATYGIFECDTGFYLVDSKETKALITCIGPLWNTNQELRCVPVEDKLDEKQEEVLTIAMNVGCAIIILILAVGLVLFFVVSDFSNDRVFHMCEELSLLICHLLMMVGLYPNGVMEDKNKKDYCDIYGISMHYWFTALFTFIGLESYHLFVVLSNLTPGQHKTPIPTIVILCVGFGLPAVLSGIVAAIFYGDYGSDYSCWINFNNMRLTSSIIYPILALVWIALFFTEEAGRARLERLPLQTKARWVGANVAQTTMWAKLFLNISAMVFGAWTFYHRTIGSFACLIGVHIALAIYLVVAHLFANSVITKLLDKCSKKKVGNDGPERDGSGYDGWTGD